MTITPKINPSAHAPSAPAEKPAEKPAEGQPPVQPPGSAKPGEPGSASSSWDKEHEPEKVPPPTYPEKAPK